MSYSVARMNAHFDIRILNRKKRIFEAFISPYPEEGVVLEKGAVKSSSGMLNIPLVCNDNVLGYISHVIEFYEFLYIKGYFTDDLEESLFNVMNSGTMSHTLIEFSPHLEKTKQGIRHIFSMNIFKFYVHTSQGGLLNKKSMIDHQVQMMVKNMH